MSTDDTQQKEAFEKTLERIEQDKNREEDYFIQLFAYQHLPPHLQVLSKPFHDLAVFINANCKKNPERSTAFRKLLESKDAAVRTAIVQFP